MIEFIKKYGIGFLLSAIIFGPLGYVTATTIAARNITYNGANTNVNLTNVQDAIEELYNMADPLIQLNFNSCSNSAGGSTPSFNPKTVRVGQEMGELPTMENFSTSCTPKPGRICMNTYYYFVGWYTESNCSGTMITSSTVVDANTPTEYYACYEDAS